LSGQIAGGEEGGEEGGGGKMGGKEGDGRVSRLNFREEGESWVESGNTLKTVNLNLLSVSEKCNTERKIHTKKN